MKLKLTILLVVLTSTVFSQNDSIRIKEIFEKSQKFYENIESYQLNMAYIMYKSAIDNEEIENFKSLVIKNGNDYYTKIHNTEFVQIGTKSLKINHDELAAEVSARSLTNNGIGLITNMLSMLPRFKEYSVSETSDGFLCEFISPAITQLPFTKVQIYFNKDFSLKSQVLFMANALPYQENNKQVLKSPRLEIKLSEIKPYQLDEKCMLATYLDTKANTDVLSSKYSNFQLIAN